ncbi:MAG: aminotransferase class I/II-fold pyridoxal phosphate-dependent enzyme [Lachnospiraceae bacterium]|nr:aminotransferase class I/II-fold pyridoxal phosphate-dependent enzyme [Lachnospiraceae bacterium]
MALKQSDLTLTQKLREYAESDFYPCHMPGHKGSGNTGSVFDCLHGMDITEIDGFDNLHHADDILRKVQDDAATAFGADASFYLVGGSTTGILAAVSAALPAGGELLIARNCHKSVYHAAYLRSLKLHYILPGFDREGQIFEPVTACQVRDALKRHPDAGAVLITSPTYEGLTANVEEIAEVVHKQNIPLIVDEAHGAHFGFAECLPPNSNAWADLVVQSLHKTTKALTQTALLHVNGERVPAALVQRYLDIYMTSSPSYLLMASMEEAVVDLRDHGEKLYREFMERVSGFLRQTAELKQLFVYNGKRNKADPCKILICSRMTEFSGKDLYNVLLQRYHLQMELCENNHVLAIMMPYDRQEGFDRLAVALNEIDQSLLYGLPGKDCSRSVNADMLPVCLPRQAKILAESWGGGHFVPLSECDGKVSAEFIYQYPPGIPLIVPGEVWDEAAIHQVKERIARGYEILGINEKSGTIGAMVNDDG